MPGVTAKVASRFSRWLRRNRGCAIRSIKSNSDGVDSRPRFRATGKQCRPLRRTSSTAGMWEGHDVDPDERTARVKGNERPLPPPLLLQLPLCTSRIDGCCLTILVAKATKMEISHSSKAERTQYPRAKHLGMTEVLEVRNPMPTTSNSQPGRPPRDHLA
jgi:hypothetical protein